MTIKSKVLPIRLTTEQYKIIEDNAKLNNLAVSTFARSIVLGSLNVDSNMITSSPSPNLDNLSFNTRQVLLRNLDASVFLALAEGFTVEELEKYYSYTCYLNRDVLKDTVLSSLEHMVKNRELIKTEVIDYPDLPPLSSLDASVKH